MAAARQKPRILQRCLALICLICDLGYALAAKNMLQRRIQYVGTEVTFNPKYFSSLTSRIINGTLNMDIYVVNPLPVGLRSFIDIQIRLTNSRHFQTLLSFDVDVCKMLNEVFKESLVRTWFRNLLKYANFMENCPVHTGYYYIHNFTLEAGSIPVYLQTGDYRFRSLAYYGKRKSKREVMVLDLTNELRIL